MSAAVLATCSFAAPGSRKPLASSWARVGDRFPIVASNAFGMSSTLVTVGPPFVRVHDQHTDGGHPAVQSVLLDEPVQPLRDVGRFRTGTTKVVFGRDAREDQERIPAQSSRALDVG